MIRAPHAAAAWWGDMQPDPANQRKGDRGALARLRRCASVSAAMQEAATIRLFQRVGGTAAADLPAVALAAATLAHVREDVAGVTVARAIGPQSVENPETALLKPLRFRRLLETVEPDERLVAFRRLAALAGGRLPVADLAVALMDWTDERRRRWVYDYWNAGQPRQDAGTEPAVATTTNPEEPIA